MRLRLQPSTRANTVQIPVDVEFEQICRIVTRPPHPVRSNALESSRRKIQVVDKCINETDRIIRSNVVVHSIGEKQELGAVITSDMCHSAFYQTPWATRSRLTPSICEN